MDQRETESGCSVLEEVAVLATGPEPAAFTCEPFSFRLVERPRAPSAPPIPALTPAQVTASTPAPTPAPIPAPANLAAAPANLAPATAPAPAPANLAPAPAPTPKAAPALEEVEVQPPRTLFYAADDDDELDDDDDVGEVAQRPARVDPRLTDPDTLERAKRVEVYRAMIEQDPNSSIFTRTNSPPRRVLPAPRTL